MLLSTGESWLGSATSPIAAMTAEIAEQQRHARRDQRAEGDHQDQQGDREREQLGLAPGRSWKVSLSSLFELTLPNCSTRQVGVGRPRPPSIASCEGSIRSRASRSSPVISNSTSAECPSADTGAVAGERRLDVLDVLGPRRAGRTAARPRSGTPGSSIVSVSLCTSTSSSLGRSPGRRAACSARCGLAGELVGAVDLLSCVTALPTIDRDDHERRASPRSRVLRWFALQCAARDARPPRRTLSAGGGPSTPRSGFGSGWSWITGVFMRTPSRCRNADGLAEPLRSQRAWKAGRPVSRGPVFWCIGARRGARARRQLRRKSSTASTRRDSLPVEGRPSLPKMLETYFSTARTVITSLSAMP